MTVEQEQMGIMDRLRTETRPHHDRAEQSEFGSSMMAKTLSLSAYKIHIAAHREVLRSIEDAHESSDSPRIGEVWHDGLKKVPLLDADLDALGHSTGEMPAEVREAVDRFVSMVERRASEKHESLPGVLYVLEGSTMGGTILRKMIADSLDLTEGKGLDYYSVYGNDVRKHFMDFKERMTRAYEGTEHGDDLVDAAKETFDLVGDVMRSIPLNAKDEGADT